MKVQKTDNAVTRGSGAWVPWNLVEELCRKRLGRASQWQVLNAVTMTQQRYGGRDALMTQKQLTRVTGLSESTVKRALKALLGLGIIIRTKRCGALRLNLLNAGMNGQVVDVNLSNRSHRAGRLIDVDGSRVCTNAPKGGDTNCGVFSLKQAQLMSDIFQEASSLIGADAMNLALPDAGALKLGIAKGTTYRSAVGLICNRRSARDFIGIVLALRKDGRVQGNELTL